MQFVGPLYTRGVPAPKGGVPTTVGTRVISPVVRRRYRPSPPAIVQQESPPKK
jgi:hypothetical protein